MKHEIDFVCSTCDRKQSFAPDDVQGGITVKEALSIGWVRMEPDGEGWQCPMCSGNEEKLRKVFGSPTTQ